MVVSGLALIPWRVHAWNTSDFPDAVAVATTTFSPRFRAPRASAWWSQCEQLVQEITAIVREEKQSDQLSMQNEDGHVITLKYGGITVDVYSEGT